MSDFVKGVSASDKSCITNGVNIVTGGTGIADLSLAAPSPGHRCVIRILSTAGNVDVLTPTGVTFDGTNNRARFDDDEESLTLVYHDYNKWAIEINKGSVTMASV